MHIALMIPPTDLHSSYGKLRDFSNPQPAIGLAYMAAVLRREGMSPKVIDCYASQMPVQAILAELENFRADVLGISCLSTTYEAVRGLALAVRKHFPTIKIVAGNVHASMFAEEMLRDNVADCICHHEGEYTFAAICKAYGDNASLASVKGISYKENGEIITTGDGEKITDLDSIPYPAWDLFDFSLYHSDPRTEVVPGKVEMQILATRGCPNSCTFCSSHRYKALGRDYRMRSPANICDEMEYMRDHYEAKVFSFVDLAFPLVKKHAMALFEEMLRRKLDKDILWTTECRVKPLDLETVQGMRASGCVRVNFGIESGNDEILKSIKKNFTTEDVKKAVVMTARAGIQVDGMFILGLPGETREQIFDTIRLATSLPVRYAIFNLFVPYPGSELYDVLTQQGKIHFNRWSDFTSYGGYSGSDPVYVPDGFTAEEIMQFQKIAMRRFYLRPKFIWEEIKRLRPAKIKAYLHGLTALLRG